MKLFLTILSSIRLKGCHKNQHYHYHIGILEQVHTIMSHISIKSFEGIIKQSHKPNIHIQHRFANISAPQNKFNTSILELNTYLIHNRPISIDYGCLPFYPTIGFAYFVLQQQAIPVPNHDNTRGFFALPFPSLVLF